MLFKSKIIPKLFGGLGNQLFIYAAMRRLSLVNKSELVIDDVSGFIHDKVYQRYYQLEHFNIHCRKATAAELLQPFSRVRHKFLRSWHQRKPFEHRSYLVQEGIDFDPRLLTFKPKGTVYIEGYWQSEDYFKDVSTIIRKDLKITPPVNAINLEMAQQIQDVTSAAVHIRFFDNLHAGFSNNAPSCYYTRAIAEMERIVPGCHYFIFSDKPEDAQLMIPLPSSRVTFVHHNQGDSMAYADLWLMSLCQHFIIANSTFSWWGAWLSENPHKIVFAPAFEMRAGVTSWGFKGILPEGWNKV